MIKATLNLIQEKKKTLKSGCLNLGQVPKGALIISRSAVLSWLKLISSLLEKTKAPYYHAVAASPSNESQTNFLLCRLSWVRRMRKPASSHQRIPCFIHASCRQDDELQQLHIFVNFHLPSKTSPARLSEELAADWPGPTASWGSAGTAQSWMVFLLY